MAGQPVTTERCHLKNLRARLLSFLEKQPDDKDKGRTQKKIDLVNSRLAEIEVYCAAQADTGRFDTDRRLMLIVGGGHLAGEYSAAVQGLQQRHEALSAWLQVESEPAIAAEVLEAAKSVRAACEAVARTLRNRLGRQRRGVARCVRQSKDPNDFLLAITMTKQQRAVALTTAKDVTATIARAAAAAPGAPMDQE